MTGKTHKVYAVFFAFVSTMILYTILNFDIFTYYILLIVMLPFAKEGAKFPDLDHNWESVSDHTVPKKIINTIIHITGGKHRSWQTHSWDIFVWWTLGSLYAINKITEMGWMSTSTQAIYLAVLVSFNSGWFSHLMSDSLTSAGVRPFCWRKKTVAFVPKKFGKIVFKTGGEWEEFNFKTIGILNKFVGALSIIYPFVLELQRNGWNIQNFKIM